MIGPLLVIFFSAGLEKAAAGDIKLVDSMRIGSAIWDLAAQQLQQSNQIQDEIFGLIETIDLTDASASDTIENLKHNALQLSEKHTKMTHLTAQLIAWWTTLGEKITLCTSLGSCGLLCQCSQYPQSESCSSEKLVLEDMLIAWEQYREEYAQIGKAVEQARIDLQRLFSNAVDNKAGGQNQLDANEVELKEKKKALEAAETKYQSSVDAITRLDGLNKAVMHYESFFVLSRSLLESYEASEDPNTELKKDQIQRITNKWKWLQNTSTLYLRDIQEFDKDLSAAQYTFQLTAADVETKQKAFDKLEKKMKTEKAKAKAKAKENQKGIFKLFGHIQKATFINSQFSTHVVNLLKSTKEKFAIVDKLYTSDQKDVICSTESQDSAKDEGRQLAAKPGILLTLYSGY